MKHEVKNVQSEQIVMVPKGREFSVDDVSHNNSYVGRSGRQEVAILSLKLFICMGAVRLPRTSACVSAHGVCLLFLSIRTYR